MSSHSSMLSLTMVIIFHCSILVVYIFIQLAQSWVNQVLDYSSIPISVGTNARSDQDSDSFEHVQEF